MRIINSGIPVRRRILLSLIIPSEPMIHPGMIASIENQFDDGNQYQRNKKDDTHDPAIQFFVVLVTQAQRR